MELEEFVKDWTKDFQRKTNNIKLFNPETKFSEEQKKKFASFFWHVRGHFPDTLFTISAKVPYYMRKIILDNIADELGTLNTEHKSHEHLYQVFSKEVGEDTSEYVFTHKNYLKFIKDYIDELNAKFVNSNSDECISMFTAYELLDEIDYVKCYQLVKKWELSKKGLEFWRVHAEGNHYTELKDTLNNIYSSNIKAVEDGFRFISNHQINMWKNLSKIIFNE